MNKAELLFKAIDIFGDIPQNAVRYPEVVRIRDIPYSDTSEEFNVGDIYFKNTMLNDGQKHPILLYIHGGGFIKGDKDYRVTNSEFFAHHGYFVYNIDYRMPPEISLTENFSDIVKALNFIGELAKTYNIDTEKIVVSGDSSGAYQTAMLASCIFDDELRAAFDLPKAQFKPAALALMCGLYDMQQLLSGPTLFGLLPETASMILGFKVKHDMSNIDQYEYINFISPVHLTNKNWCPVFMTWAKNDVICIGQGPSMAQALEDNEIKTSVYIAEDFHNNHCFHLNMLHKAAKECMNQCVDFLNEVLGIEEKEENGAEDSENEENSALKI